MRLQHNTRGSLSLRILLASLIAVAVVLILTFKFQLSAATEHVRAQGVNLARLVTKLPVSAQQRSGWEQVLMYQLSSRDFAYGTVVSANGTTLVEVTASGVIVPGAGSLAGNAWVQEVQRSVQGAEVIEWYGPLRVGDEMGHFRIGFFKPTLVLALVSEQLPFIASLILPVFLLAPLFLLLVKREVNPLTKVNAELTTMLRDSKPTGGTGQAKPDDLRGVIDQFNQFLVHAKGQIAEYQDEKSKLVTSGKFLSYRLHRFEAILNSLPDGVLVVDHQACVSFANLRVRSLLSLQPEDLLGARVSECLQHPELIAHFTKHETNLGRLVGEALIFSPQNQPDLSVSAVVHRLNDGDEGSAHHYLVVFRDVSSEARARQSRSEFVAHLAHELKNPLHTLAMYAEALQDEADTPQEFQVEAVNVIGDEVERLARLINNLLSMTQIEMGTLQLDRQRIKLVDLVRDTVQAMERSARGRELSFEMDLPNEVVPVQVDKDLLRIALNNLLTNAIKYTDPGGTISVSVSESDEAVSISVADTGIGIAEEDQAQIFQKFFRAGGDDMESRSGHGLGLPLARDIVELHHGSIRVESEPGQGSRFTIDLWKHAGVMRQAI